MSQNNIELVGKIDSINFYTKIYKKACNSLWVIRPTFLYILTVGLSLCIMSFFIFINNILTTTMNTVVIKRLLALFISGLLLFIPSMIVLFKNRKSGSRSKKYIAFLKDLKSERSLDNEDIDKLLEDVANLKISYKNERDTIGKILLSIMKLFLFPITAAIFTGLISNLYFLGYVLAFLCTLIVSMVLVMWTDFKSFQSLKYLGIKNSYLLLSVERELRYMKKL
ncbi:hypothetical protein [Carnobacterium maltaromaticum]|uniref:hypothetical protein n=1 Tax=Carnobacterium maltaromaticum TaxID=2751 RepID=UPI00055754AB|nr:hypothetical protein [Carnobacterium maltaromaticum]KRN60854.1 hypothetical protein IV70_GL000671 [Carnobacterium maltaromaticum DSM 20342]CAD5902941.1 conserved membrane hypothetical protein [Carnobacterium maltaromaticum]